MKRYKPVTGPDFIVLARGKRSSWMRLTTGTALIQCKRRHTGESMPSNSQHICCTQAVKTNVCPSRHTRDRPLQLMDATEHRHCFDPVQAKAYWRVHAINAQAHLLHAAVKTNLCPTRHTRDRASQLMDATEHRHCFDPVQAKAYWRVHAINSQAHLLHAAVKLTVPDPSHSRSVIAAHKCE